jgi:hypothetical protein
MIVQRLHEPAVECEGEQRTLMLCAVHCHTSWAVEVVHCDN